MTNTKQIQERNIEKERLFRRFGMTLLLIIPFIVLWKIGNLTDRVMESIVFGIGSYLYLK